MVLMHNLLDIKELFVNQIGTNQFNPIYIPHNFFIFLISNLEFSEASLKIWILTMTLYS